MPSRSTPQEAFDAARSAMARQDWDAFFACLDPADVRRIVKNGLNLLGRDPELETICVEAGVDRELLAPVKELASRMAEAAEAALSGGAVALKDLVDAHRKAVDAVARAAPVVAVLAAAIERHLRAAMAGGSVSTSLFVGETLERVTVDGNVARGTRRTADGATESVGFVRRGGEWQVRLFAR